MDGAHLSPDTLVLEIGCGVGNFTEFFLRSGAKIIATDISPDLLRIAREKNWPQGQVRFVEKRFEDFDISEPFDSIIGSSVLHHLEVPEALEVIYRLLKPNGRISFAEPNLLNPQVYFERRFSHLPYFASYVSPDEIAFIRWNLFDLLHNIGFVDINITPFDWLHPAVPRPYIGGISKIGELLESLPLVREFSGSLAIQARRPS